MLYRTPEPSVKKVLTITGRQFSSNKWPKSQRAALAACRLFQISRGYLQRALALPAALRWEMAQSDLTITEMPPEPTDKQLADTVRAAGIERTWQPTSLTIKL